MQTLFEIKYKCVSAQVNKCTKITMQEHYILIYVIVLYNKYTQIIDHYKFTFLIIEIKMINNLFCSSALQLELSIYIDHIFTCMQIFSRSSIENDIKKKKKQQVFQNAL